MVFKLVNERVNITFKKLRYRKNLIKWEPSYTIGGNVNWCSRYGRAVWRLLKKPKVDLPYDPAIPHLGIYLEKSNLKRHMHPYVHSSTIYNS